MSLSESCCAGEHESAERATRDRFSQPVRSMVRMTGMDITPTIAIPDDELRFTFARSGGPGGQNVNKVSSKAILHWHVESNATLPAEVKDRLRRHHANRLTTEGVLVIHGQRFRDQAKNVADCRDRLREMVLQAMTVPKVRRPTKPSRGSKRRRLEAKRRQSERKAARRIPGTID